MGVRAPSLLLLGGSEPPFLPLGLRGSEPSLWPGGLRGSEPPLPRLGNSEPFLPLGFRAPLAAVGGFRAPFAPVGGFRAPFPRRFRALPEGSEPLRIRALLLCSPLPPDFQRLFRFSQSLCFVQCPAECLLKLWLGQRVD